MYANKQRRVEGFAGVAVAGFKGLLVYVEVLSSAALFDLLIDTVTDASTNISPRFEGLLGGVVGGGVGLSAGLFVDDVCSTRYF